MIEVKNVQLQVDEGNDKVRVTGRINFGQGEVGKKYRIRIEIFADDTGEKQFNLGPLYTFRFGESESQYHKAGTPQVAALFKTITAVPTVNIDETDNLDIKKLDEDPGWHIKQTPNGPIPYFDEDEVFAVISVLEASGSNKLIKKERSETLSGVFL